MGKARGILGAVGTVAGGVIGGIYSGGSAIAPSAAAGGAIGGAIGGAVDGPEQQKGKTNVSIGPSQAMGRRMQEISQPGDSQEMLNQDLEQSEKAAAQAPPNYMARYQQLLAQQREA